MNKIEIDALLNKYWNAETSIEEEQLLRNYFSGSRIDDAHLPFRPLFGFYQEESVLRSERPFMGVRKKRKPAIIRFILGNRTIATAAASLLVLISFMIGLRLDQHKNALNQAQLYSYSGDEENLDEAYAITQEAIAFLSGKFHRGQGDIQKNMHQIEKLDIIQFQ